MRGRHVGQVLERALARVELRAAGDAAAEAVHGRDVEAVVGELLEERRVLGVHPHPPHRYEVHAGETVRTRDLPRPLQEPLRPALVLGALLHAGRTADRHHGLAVDPVVLDVVKAVRAPVVRQLLLVRERVVAVVPHHVPLQVLAVARLAERLHPVVPRGDAVAPVPAHGDEGDAVLDEVLDLPVHRLGRLLVVPAEDRLARVVVAPHRMPLVIDPAGEHQRADRVGRGADRLRLRRIVEARKVQRRLDVGHHLEPTRRDAVGRDGQSEHVPPRAEVAQPELEHAFVRKLRAAVVVQRLRAVRSR